MRYEIRVVDSDDWNAEELYRIDDDGEESQVFDGCMEPEDARLCRDLGVFVVELNNNAKEINRLRALLRQASLYR